MTAAANALLVKTAVIAVCNDSLTCTPQAVTPADSLSIHCSSAPWPTAASNAQKGTMYCAWGEDTANTFFMGRWEEPTLPQGKYVTAYTDRLNRMAEITVIYTD